MTTRCDQCDAPAVFFLRVKRKGEPGTTKARCKEHAEDIAREFLYGHSAPDEMTLTTEGSQ